MSGRKFTAISVGDRLGLGEEAMAWLEELQSVGEPPTPVELPLPNESAVLLARLGVPSARIQEAVAARPSPERDPALWWILARCSRLLVQDMGGIDPMRSWPSLPPNLGSSGRYFYVWVFLATLDAVRQFHLTRGIPDDVSWATRQLECIFRKSARCRRKLATPRFAGRSTSSSGTFPRLPATWRPAVPGCSTSSSRSTFPRPPTSSVFSDGFT